MSIETVDTIQCELMLLKWSEDSANGGILRFQVDNLEPFKLMTEAKGKRAGQRFMAVLAPIADDETPDKLPVGPLCKLAVQWCREAEFANWLRTTFPTLWATVMDESIEHMVKQMICHICGIASRKELDHNANAKRAFNELIRRPYAEYLANRDQPVA